MALWGIDGTLCTRNDNSNVLKFALRYRGGKSYWTGPGTKAQSIGAGGAGAVFGTGAARIVRGVCEQICQARKKDKDLVIDLVGFSRGAAIANEVASVLCEQGCPCGEEKDGKKVIPQVRFLGLFDPVHSMGFPLIAQGKRDATPLFLGNRRWNGKTIPRNVRHSAIAYADDERDKLFRPSDLVALHATRNHHRAKFDGVHGDVGGTLGNNRHLGQISLRWMVLEAVAAGVEMNTAGLVTDAWIENASRRGWLMPSSGRQATGERGWALML